MSIEVNLETNPVAGIFDDEKNSDWIFPSPALCKRENIYPNLLAYSKSLATLVVIVKRSATGQDFALSEAGLLYIEATLAKGALKDGTPVCAAFVVLADVDLSHPPQQLRMVSYSSAQEMRDSRYGLRPYLGKFGPYWWITADALTDEDASFL
jgi:hypothetical protein